jgi:hypothetical protein
MRTFSALAGLAICLSVAADTPKTAADRTRNAEPGAGVKPEGLPYKEGTVVSLTFVRTKPGMTNDYLRNLAAEWRKLNDEAKKEGLILSYKIYLGSAVNKDDWDMMLQIEYKDMAALDGIDEKFEAISARVLGPEEKVTEGYRKRGDMREILGEKIVREVVLK